ncbi:hypothetical protein SARC_00713 [Sphaeroforma arctica JP610]|uniref:Alpha-N-acetylglucosaminidase N-terminal domain-containing protein n=1 Tax=Sphaeroforma arctica JP610 TaxID=667725 RepID=A0A0L0GDV0_9EUKA|nr:hypothetical protein SARC_00713 [Sphaeroforma arctica JP610]KNC87185.1 hypothetical protein SARC_00713 [Sphaeroforma arctica JP610]|eukprot:XP_014161087.1 hypothetical protein SARC_00713 [Sphaeroforma arctica JP610]
MSVPSSHNDVTKTQTIISIVRSGEYYSLQGVPEIDGNVPGSVKRYEEVDSGIFRPTPYKTRSQALHAAHGVLQRVLGASITKGFTLGLLERSDGDSTFVISSTAEPNVVVTLRGTTTLALTSALSYYMTHFMKSSISLTGYSTPKLPLCEELATGIYFMVHSAELRYDTGSDHRCLGKCAAMRLVATEEPQGILWLLIVYLNSVQEKLFNR